MSVLTPRNVGPTQDERAQDPARPVVQSRQRKPPAHDIHWQQPSEGISGKNTHSTASARVRTRSQSADTACGQNTEHVNFGTAVGVIIRCRCSGGCSHGRGADFAFSTGADHCGQDRRVRNRRRPAGGAFEWQDARAGPHCRRLTARCMVDTPCPRLRVSPWSLRRNRNHPVGSSRTISSLSIAVRVLLMCAVLLLLFYCSSFASSCISVLTGCTLNRTVGRQGPEVARDRYGPHGDLPCSCLLAGIGRRQASCPVFLVSLKARGHAA